MSSQSEYRIVSVKLLNYRQYFGEQEAVFSPREQGFSVFLGENGEGKSNLLNAINWCFFHREPHMKENKGMPIINSRYLDELADGSQAEMRVTVELERGSTKYRVSRTLKGIKNRVQKERIGEHDLVVMDRDSVDPIPKGFQVVRSETDEAFSVSRDGGSFELEKSFRVGVNQLLPEKLAPFYLLDGEFLAKLFSQFEGIEQGIEQVSQLELIMNAKSHVAYFVSTISPGKGKDVDKITGEIRNLNNLKNSLDARGNLLLSQEPRYQLGNEEETEFHPASGLPRLKSKEGDNARIRQRLNQISEELGNNSAASIKELEDHERRLLTDINAENGYLSKAEGDYYNSLVKFGPVVFLKDAVAYSADEIERSVELGKLPNKITIIFTDNLLKKGECFCGTDLNGESNPHRSKVLEKQKQAADDSRLDPAIELEYDYAQILRVYPEELRRFDENRKSVKDHKDRLLTLHSELKGVREAVKNSGDQRARELIDEQTSLLEAMSANSTQIGEIKTELQAIEKEMREKVKELNKVSTKNKKAQILTHELTHWQTAAEQLDQIYATLKETIRKQVQEKTTFLFRQIMWKQDFTDVVIDENYNLRVLRGEYNAINELSSGERMFLALAFIAAIRDITGYKFPLIIDTPLGRISGTPRIKIAQKFKEFLPNSQLVLLATDTEYISPIVDIDNPYAAGRSFKDYFEESSPTKVFRIRMDRKNSTSSIEPYMPKVKQTPRVA